MLAEQNMAVMEEFLALKHTMKINFDKLSSDFKNTCERLEIKIETGLDKINTKTENPNKSKSCITRSATTPIPPPLTGPTAARSGHSPPRRRRTTPFLKK